MSIYLNSTFSFVRKKAILLCCYLFFTALISLQAQDVIYSPTYFGPNANPVAEFTDATIPKTTQLDLSYNSFFGFGDKTTNLHFRVEVPLFSKRVSLKVWTAILENYEVTETVYNKRNMQEGMLEGRSDGDIYVQTRIRILSERKYLPSIIVNTTLKTASGTHFENRRFFDTPGYYFDMELGKSIHTKSKVVNEIRFVANAGFLCWETTGSRQNDAVMYGGKLILSNQLFDLENSLAGYRGRLKNGDAPVTYNAKFIYKQPTYHFYVRYQYGIKDYPYHQIQAGVVLLLAKLTPHHKWTKKKGISKQNDNSIE